MSNFATVNSEVFLLGILEDIIMLINLMLSYYTNIHALHNSQTSHD
jgi:hypothetical protein